MACKNFYCVTTITVGVTNVTLAFATMPTVTDESRFCFKLQDSIPATGASLPVVLSINGTTVALHNRFGNAIMGSELKPCKLYKGLYGSTTPAVIVTNVPMTIPCL